MAKYQLRLLNSFSAFEAAARHQSIQRAADELHVTHAAVSRHINKLELYLACRLFERSHRQIALTDDGKLLYDSVGTGFDHIQRALYHLARKRNQDQLVISVDPDFAALWLVPRLAEFYAMVPNTLVDIRAERSSLPLRNPEIDCVIHYAEASSGAQSGESLFQSNLFPVCTKALADRDPLNSWEDLGRHVLLHDRSVDEWADYFRACGGALSGRGRPGILFNETAHCLDAAVRGQGVALGDDFLASMLLSEGRLVRGSCPSVRSNNAYFLIVSESVSKHPTVKAFRTWLLGAVARHE
jgi:LysR family transcriptional regulator, glycine cleavage system transcriptional activator